MTNLTAWQAGFSAGQAGESRCPYTAGTIEAWSWYAGCIESAK